MCLLKNFILQESVWFHYFSKLELVYRVRVWFTFSLITIHVKLICHWPLIMKHGHLRNIFPLTQEGSDALPFPNVGSMTSWITKISTRDTRFGEIIHHNFINTSKLSINSLLYSIILSLEVFCLFVFFSKKKTSLFWCKHFFSKF